MVGKRHPFKNSFGPYWSCSLCSRTPSAPHFLCGCVGGGNFEGGREGSALPGDDGVFLEIAYITHWKEGEGGSVAGAGEEEPGVY